MLIDYSLYLIMDDSICPPQHMGQLLRKVIHCGVTCIQLRMKQSSKETITKIAKSLLTITKQKNIPLIINDHLDIAATINADGVHIGQNDIPYAQAREYLGYTKIIGLSIGNIEQAKQCSQYDVDYFGVGPVYSTTTKRDAENPLGIQQLRHLIRLLPKPVVAIGGLNKQNILPVLESNVQGLAFASAILAATSPELETKHIARIISVDRYKQISELKKISKKKACVLTIAGSDSSGGAGIEADIKSISAIGCYAAAVITALTAQNTLGVQAIYPIPDEFVIKQMESVLSDLTISTIKIGMLLNTKIIHVVNDTLRKYSCKRIILDPVMVSKNGCALLKADAIAELKKLLSSCILITPNISEAEILLDKSITTVEAMEEAAKMLGKQYKTNFLIKGGHLDGTNACDVLYLYDNATCHWYESMRIETKNTHGTGCTLSSAIAAYLARDYNLPDAISAAKQYLTQAIQSGIHLKIGHGVGPVDHFFKEEVNHVI